MQQTRRDGGGLATTPREWHRGAPTKPCPHPERREGAPSLRGCRAEPRNAAGWTRQNSAGTRETARKAGVGYLWVARAEGDSTIVPGRGHGGFPGAAPTLRHPTAPGPPVRPFPNPNLGAKEDKDDPNTGNGSSCGVSSCPEHDPQLSWVEQVQIKFRLVGEGQLFTDCLSLQFFTQMKHAGSYA